VALRALFGIEFISGYAKDVVALNANAMNVLLNRRGRRGVLGLRLSGSVGSLCHGGHSITASRGVHACGGPGYPSGDGNLRKSGKGVEKWSNLLIDFRLAGRPLRETASKLHQLENCRSAGPAKAKVRPAGAKRKNADRQYG
jgi:hypothetical protein